MFVFPSDQVVIDGKYLGEVVLSIKIAVDVILKPNF